MQQGEEAKRVKCEVVGADPNERITLERLEAEVASGMNRRVTTRTFRRWRRDAGVVPHDDGLYSASDADYLLSLDRWLTQPGKQTIVGFNRHQQFKKTNIGA